MLHSSKHSGSYAAIGALTGLLGLGILGGCAGSGDEQDSPPAQFDLQLERAQLDNGMELVVAPNRTAPVVTALIAFRAGAFVEDAEHNGYSHLFEHMIFQGSKQVPDAVEFRDRFAALGALSNATTGVDRVTYFFEAERDALDDALALFAGALREPALLDAELEKEKQVVLAEIDLDESNPAFLLQQRLLEELFDSSYSRVQALGSRDAVSAATSDQLRHMHDTYYVPNNALLVLSGDITRERALDLAKRHFGDWRRADDPLEAQRPPQLDVLAQDRYVVLEAPISDTRINVAWQCPGVEADPKAALAGDLLSAVTFQSDHGFRVLQQPKLAIRAGLYFTPMRHASYVTVQLTLEQGHEWAVLDSLQDTLRDLATEGDISRAQLAQAKADVWSSFFFTSDDPDSVPHAIAQQWGTADVASYQTLADDTYAVDTDDLRRFADSCIRNPRRAVVLMSSAANLSKRRITADGLRNSFRGRE